MWNTQKKAIPRSHIIDVAIADLERAHSGIMSEEGVGDYPEALNALKSQNLAINELIDRFEKAMAHPSYDSATRFEAVGQALRLIKTRLGQ